MERERESDWESPTTRAVAVRHGALLGERWRERLDRGSFLSRSCSLIGRG